MKEKNLNHVLHNSKIKITCSKNIQKFKQYTVIKESKYTGGKSSIQNYK